MARGRASESRVNRGSNPSPPLYKPQCAAPSGRVCAGAERAGCHRGEVGAACGSSLLELVEGVGVHRYVQSHLGLAVGMAGLERLGLIEDLVE